MGFDKMATGSSQTQLCCDSVLVHFATEYLMKRILCSKITWTNLLNWSKMLEINAKIIQLGNIKYIFWEYY